MTYVTSSELIQAIYRDPQTFHFTEIRQEMQVRVFQMPHEVSYSEELSQSFFPAHHRALVPGKIRSLLAAYARFAYSELSARVHTIESLPKGTPLAAGIVSPAAYNAAAKALYGATYHARETMGSFMQFDGVFHMVAGGLPLWLMPSARKGWEDVIEHSVEHVRFLRKSKLPLTDFMEMFIGEGDKHDWSDRVVANILAISLWAVQANTTWAIYWCIVFLLQHPEVPQAVLSELELARSRWISSHPESPLTPETFPEFLQDSPDAFPILTSCIHETLRLRSSSFSIRRVGTPTEFAGYHFDVDDQVVCNTRAVHMDERVYERAQEFVFDRFTDAGKKRAMLSGRSASPPFLPFGGGVSMCEGRHFAMGAMRAFITTLFTFYTVEVAPSSIGQFPEPQMERIGVGLTYASQNPLISTVLALPVVYFTYSLLKPCDPRSPPQVSYWIPWLGSALTMSRDPDEFFKGATEKLGPVFKVKAMGRNTTYVTSPSLIAAVYRDSKTFEFQTIRAKFSINAFSIPPHVVTMPQMTEDYYPAHHRVNAPKNIGSILTRYATYTFRHLRAKSLNFDGASGSLNSLMIMPAYVSAAHAFFSERFPAEKTYADFAKFNDAFHVIAAGLPKFMTAEPRKAWERVADVIEVYVKDEREKGEMTELVEATLNVGDSAGWDDHTMAAMLASDLWAMQANAIFAAYWFVVLLLQHPEDLQRINAEVLAANAKWKTTHPNTPLSETNFPQFMTELADQFPLITSGIMETLRLRTSNFSIRRVTTPTELDGFKFDVDDELICNLRVVHMDEEVHERPYDFVLDRYVDSGKKYSKNGVPVSNHSMPFGGGVSICEGRHFAQAEIKTFIVALLSIATVEVDEDPTATWPDLAMDRIGVGIISPKGDVNVIVNIIIFRHFISMLRHNEYVGSDANSGRIPGAEKATTGHHYISVFPKEGAPTQGKGERKPEEHMPPPTGRGGIADVSPDTSNQFTERLSTFRNSEPHVQDSQSQQPQPLSPAPDSRTVVDTDPFAEPTSAADTMTGATSKDVHGGIGKPGSGMTSAERHHEGSSHRKRNLQGLGQYGNADELFEE
ncbi:Cholesterol 7-alpha-monooxygenase [Steccherinum ochraceum]|uniref:Cholesterol 7-alpha-monooxygenase n=1 Tax=Steccherinum ochraceum TaxID=92696 RepID=A0A4R0RNL6_9APHY|nr:Cholesterol 7-alpha-monooxygenase [Steccherinum ochraceum]